MTSATEPAEAGRPLIHRAPTSPRQSVSGATVSARIYQGSSPEAIREHARRADLPADEIVEVADTVIVRPDPAPVGT